MTTHYKYLVVHSRDVNPSEYVLAILKEKWLEDYDIIKSFAYRKSETDSDSNSDVNFHTLNVRFFLKSYNRR